ncbi:hypothetical protein EVA_13184, partial [gut metagenome]
DCISSDYVHEGAYGTGAYTYSGSLVQAGLALYKTDNRIN